MRLQLRLSSAFTSSSLMSQAPRVVWVPSVSTFWKMALKYSQVQPHQVLLMLLFLKLSQPQLSQ